MPASLSAARRSTALSSSNSAFSFSRLSDSPPGVRNRQERKRRGTYLTARKWNQSRLLQDSFDLVKPFLLYSQISVWNSRSNSVLSHLLAQTLSSLVLSEPPYSYGSSELIRFGLLWKIYDLVAEKGLAWSPPCLQEHLPGFRGWLLGGVSGMDFLVAPDGQPRALKGIIIRL